MDSIYIKKRVLVGMSGGIDSSAACMLLLDQGYDVIGLTMRIWDLPSHFNDDDQTEPNHVLEARSLAESIGIQHITLDVRAEFKNTVVQYFINEYMNGRTPNPCVMCNFHFKWHYLLQSADQYNCDLVATGHYAKTSQENGIYFLHQGKDPLKDQSYFLWRLGQKELQRTIFPLGDMLKADIKKYVLAKGYKEKVQKKESMEICFIENDYREFLKTLLPDIDTNVGEGYFVNETGKKLGKHQGYPYYTVGQRKGLGIALGYPAFVVKINPKKNTIRLGKKEDLLSKQMILEECNISDPTLLTDNLLSVKIRYRSSSIAVKVRPVAENKLIVLFQGEANAVTPGQSAVFYLNDKVVGGGIIADQKELNKYQNQ